MGRRYGERGPVSLSEGPMCWALIRTHPSLGSETSQPGVYEDSLSRVSERPLTLDEEMSS